MHRRWLSRALIALAVPALIVPAASTATAAGAAKVPTVGAVATIYPHLAGGTASASSTKVYGPGRKCGQQKVVKGASGTTASYSPDPTTLDPTDPTAYLPTGAKPSISVTAYRFATAKAAIAYLHGYTKYTKKCPTSTPGGGGAGGAQPDCTSSTKKIPFTLGDERSGYQLRSTCTSAGESTTSIFNSLFVRQGRFIVYTSAYSMDGVAPAIPTSISLTKLALKTVS